jgi:hypothetical protein
MLRALFGFAVLALVGGSAVMAAGMDRDTRAERAIAVALMAQIPR